jgi:hypothetical protein
MNIEKSNKFFIFKAYPSAFVFRTPGHGVARFMFWIGDGRIVVKIWKIKLSMEANNG